MKKRTVDLVFIIADAVMITLALLAAVGGVFTKGYALWEVGFERTMFFTVDSNIFAAATFLFALPYKINRYVKGGELPPLCAALSLVSTAAVSVTFITVAVMLGPMYGYGSVYSGNNLVLHLICPVLAIVSFCASYVTKSRLSFKTTFLCIVPTFIYATVYFVMVMVIGAENGGWADFYGFNAGGYWYISIVVMLAVSYGIGVGLWCVRDAVMKRIR